jgi:hypothetical protein
MLPKLRARDDRKGERISGYAMYVEHNIQVRSCNHSCSGKAISVTYCGCVFLALVIQHAIHWRLLQTVTCPALSYFYTLSHKRYDFR